MLAKIQVTRCHLSLSYLSRYLHQLYFAFAESISTVTIFGSNPLDDLFGLPATEFQKHLNALCHTSSPLYIHQDLRRHVWDALEWIMVGELYSFDLPFRQRGNMQESVVANMSLLHAVPMTVLDYLRDEGQPKCDQALPLEPPSCPPTARRSRLTTSDPPTDDCIGSFDNLSLEGNGDVAHLVSMHDDNTTSLFKRECGSSAPLASICQNLIDYDTGKTEAFTFRTKSTVTKALRPIPQLSPTEVVADPPPRQVQTNFEAGLDWAGKDLTDFHLDNLDDKDEEEFENDEELIKILVEMADRERAGNMC